MKFLRVRRAQIFSLVMIAIFALILQGCESPLGEPAPKPSPTYSVGQPVNVPPPPTYRGPPVNVKISPRPAPVMIVQ